MEYRRGRKKVSNDKRAEAISPCPSVYSPAAALGSLSSVALSSEQARELYHEIEKRKAVLFSLPEIERWEWLENDTYGLLSGHFWLLNINGGSHSRSSNLA
jgi:hypothetical protein